MTVKEHSIPHPQYSKGNRMNLLLGNHIQMVFSQDNSIATKRPSSAGVYLPTTTTQTTAALTQERNPGITISSITPKNLVTNPAVASPTVVGATTLSVMSSTGGSNLLKGPVGTIDPQAIIRLVAQVLKKR
jgi:hypothetical protein